MISKTVTIINRLGLHARASAKLVAMASKFLSKIELKKMNQEVNAKSIMGVMMLGASQGTQLELCTSGPDEIEAMSALEALIQNKFGEEE